MSIRKVFSYNLKYYRFKQNYSQEKLAELANINVKTLSDYERCVSAPSFDTIEKLAVALKIDYYLLFKHIDMVSLGKTIKNQCK